MPYKCEKMKIPAQYDRRNRVTPEMAETMQAMYKDGVSLHAIAKEFGVHRRTVKRHVIAGYAAAESAKRKQEKPWLKYYNSEYHREHIKNHRRYKRELELAGKLAE